MKDKSILQNYINDFRRHLSKHLRSGIGLKSAAYPIKDQGAIIEFTFIREGKNEDVFMHAETNIGYALKNIKQNSFSGDPLRLNFVNTNLILEPDRIIIIKGEDDISCFSDAAASADVEQIISPVTRGRK